VRENCAMSRTIARLLRAVAAGAVLCALACGGPKTVAKDGYRALLVYSAEDRYRVAGRGESVRISGNVDGSEIVKIVRPDRKKVWQFRPSTKKIFESRWDPTDEPVSGYPLQPGFDVAAYADRFGAKVQRIDDQTHGLHPCERWRLTLPSGDLATIWVARDLDRLVVRIEHAKKDPNDEFQPFSDTQLLDVQVGAGPKLFEPPEGYGKVRSYEELTRK
ncbi:MAG TPA: hypothetical protein VIY96_08765, partial [Thermoanaerobaculia bacterium]